MTMLSSTLSFAIAAVLTSSASCAFQPSSLGAGRRATSTNSAGPSIPRVSSSSFGVARASSRNHLRRFPQPLSGSGKTSPIAPPLQMSSSGGDGSDDASFDGGFDELKGTLARLDKLEAESDWTRLYVDDEESVDEQTLNADGSSALGRIPMPGERFVYLLEPSRGRKPSSVILFLGGAVLGQFPHVAYSEFLKRIADRTGAAVVAAPFEVGLDHFELAKRGEKLFRKALVKCEAEKDWNPALPKIALAHSLGAKLFLISMAATGSGEDLEGIGFLSFNNFGLAESIGMARSFAQDLRQTAAAGASTDPFTGERMNGGGQSPFGASAQKDAVLDVIFDFAAQAARGVGVEFSPSPKDTERIARLKFTPELQDKCRLFQFDDDELDCTQRLVEVCREAANADGEGGISNGSGPSVSGLPGTHLTPVYLNLGLDDLPETARELAGQVSGGIRGASFGSEENLDAAVDEVCNWIVGKPPTRGPKIEGGEKEFDRPRAISGGLDSDTDS